MIAKPFHATRPFIRIEILRQERQVFSSNLTISNTTLNLFQGLSFIVEGAGKYEDARHIEKKMAAENAPMINSAKWY